MEVGSSQQPARGAGREAEHSVNFKEIAKKCMQGQAGPAAFLWPSVGEQQRKAKSKR